MCNTDLLQVFGHKCDDKGKENQREHTPKKVIKAETTKTNDNNLAH
jgi:hypothetical protein